MYFYEIVRPFVSHLYKYGVSCSYDKLLRFKKSAAAFSASKELKHGLPLSNNLL